MLYCSNLCFYDEAMVLLRRRQPHTAPQRGVLTVAPSHRGPRIYPCAGMMVFTCLLLCVFLAAAIISAYAHRTRTTHLPFYYGRKLTVGPEQNKEEEALLHRLGRPGAGQAQLVQGGLTDYQDRLNRFQHARNCRSNSRCN